MPKRIQMTRNKPWRADNPDAVIVARRSAWGNPYRIGVHGDAQRCVDLFESLARGMIDNTIPNAPPIADLMRLQNTIALRLGEIRGVDLACWCKLGDPCHADVLLELANKPLKAVD